jgi:hypothetical protein
MPPTPRATSHKKKKRTRKESPNRSLTSADALRRTFTDSSSVVTPVVTQTQGDAPGVTTDQLPPSSPLIVGPKTAIDQLPSPQIADKRALAELVSGYKPSSRYSSLLVHEASRKKMRVAKLNDNVLFTFLRDPLVDAIAGATDFKPIRPSDHLKKANNHFQKIGYDTTKSKQPNEKGKSKRIASLSTKPAATPVRRPDLRHSLFPSVIWVTAFPALTHMHRRYMVEDCLQCDAEETLLLLISPQHPSFASCWKGRLSKIYAVCPTSATVFHDGGVFFSVEVRVTKNPIRELLMAGGYSVTSFLELFSFRGGSSLALRFVRCDVDGFELKFADIFYSNETIHLWGTRKDTRDLKGQLKKMNDPCRRSAMFQRYLLELYGDRASTKYLCSGFAHVLDNASNDIDLKQIRDGSISGNKIVKTFSYPGKGLSSEETKSKFSEFEAFVESRIEFAVKQCYGNFVTLTAPIISQTELNAFVKKFVELMPQQFLVIWTMLNFNDNNNLKRRMHLQAFYLRMVLYQFIAMNRIRNCKTFSWWALCNAAARYGSQNVQCRANLSVHYGISIAQTTLQRKLSSFNDYGVLMNLVQMKGHNIPKLLGCSPANFVVLIGSE